MLLSLGAIDATLAAGTIPGWLYNTVMFIKVVIGFSIIIFVHELGHFLAAKWVGIRVDRFSIGFGPRLFGYRGGEGLTFGGRPEYTADELEQRRYGETDYCFKALPIGGYVKMLGQDDVIIDDKTGDMSIGDDPRAFTNRPVGHRMIVVSAGVVFNVLFAAIVLMAVFLIGTDMPAPMIGWVDPDSPAQGKLFPGDRIVTLNGRNVDSFLDIKIGAALAEGQVRLKVERRGKLLDDEIVVETRKDAESGLHALAVEGVLTTEVTMDGREVGDRPNLLAGDRVTHIDGEPVETAFDILRVLGRSEGKVLEFTVQRPDKEDPGKSVPETCYQRAVLLISPANFESVRESSSIDDCHLLGLLRRRIIGQPTAGGPADKAGFKRGDIVASWGTVLSPTYGEIKESIVGSAGRESRVVVERQGKEVELRVTPERPFRLFGEEEPRVGIALHDSEEDRAVVADVVPGTPFAALDIPRGAELTSIDGQPVSGWFDVTEALLAAAGRTVTVTWVSGSEKRSGQVRIPSSLVNELGLPAGAIVWAVDGATSVKVPGEGGRKVEQPLRANPLALRAMLEQKVGQTVTVRYSPSLSEEGKPVEAQFTVRDDNVDPWQLRVSYLVDRFAFAPMMKLVSAEGNPWRALTMGVNVTGYQVWQVYRFLSKLLDRSVSTRNVAGPVGILNMAVQQAKAGTVELMFFLAFLSVNLAVINFLPMPVMDGGLMVFLIIEKIKGKPLSLKVQMVSTMVGVAAIVLIFLYVTIQDIGRLF